MRHARKLTVVSALAAMTALAHAHTACAQYYNTPTYVQPPPVFIPAPPMPLPNIPTYIPPTIIPSAPYPSVPYYTSPPRSFGGFDDNLDD